MGKTRTEANANLDLLPSAIPGGPTSFVPSLNTHLTNQYVANVRDSGASGSGTNDDTAAIQTMLDQMYAAGGGVVRIPGPERGWVGKYLTTSGLHMYQSVQLIGDGGGKQDHTGGGGGGRTGTQFLFAPSAPDKFLTVMRDPGGLNPNSPTNAVCSGFGVDATMATTGCDGVYFKNASFICRDVWVRNFVGGRGFRVVGAINSSFEQCLSIFSGWGLFMDPTGNLSTTLSLRNVYCASNIVNYVVQNVLGFNADDQTISESPVTDGWQIDNARRVTLARMYMENIAGYAVLVGGQNNGVTADLTIEEFVMQIGANDDITKDLIYLQHADGVRIRLLNPPPERASIVRMSNTVANVKLALASGVAESNQRATPGSARASAHVYAKGVLFTAVGDDSVTRAYIVTNPGTSGASQPSGYGIGTLNLADGSNGMTVSRYTTNTEWPVIDESLQLTSGWGDEYVRRVVGAGSVYTSNGAAEFTASAGWGFGVSAVVDARDVGGRISITSGSSLVSANPTLTLVFKDGPWSGVPVIVPARGDHVAPTTAYWEVTTRSATGCTFTFVGTPVINSTYVLDWLVVGK